VRLDEEIALSLVDWRALWWPACVCCWDVGATTMVDMFVADLPVEGRVDSSGSGATLLDLETGWDVARNMFGLELVASALF
jgi:hypothetical protein